MINIERKDEKMKIEMNRIKGKERKDIEGSYRREEIEEDIMIVREGGEIYGEFEGFIGKRDM